MPPKSGTKRGVRGGGTRGRGAAATAKPKPDTPKTDLSQNGKPFCGCHAPLAKVEGVHNPGKPITISEGLAYTAFLSIKTINIQSIIEQRALRLTTLKGDFENNRREETLRRNNEALQQEETLRRQRAGLIQQQKEQQQQRKLDEKFSKLARQKAISFLSFKYGSTVEQRQAIGNSWTSQQIIKATPAPQTGEDIKQLTIAEGTTTNGHENQPITTRTRSNFDLKRLVLGGIDQPSPSRPEYSPITPTTDSHPFAYTFARPPTPADSESGSDTEMPDQIAPHDTGGVEGALQDVILSLYNIQANVHQTSVSNTSTPNSAANTNTAAALSSRIDTLASSLRQVDQLVSDPANPLHKITIAPEVIDYVEDGRNPDIYTRDFVELVLRGNALMLSKQEGFKGFSKVFASKLKEGLEGVDGEVNMVMEGAGMLEKEGRWVDVEEVRNKGMNGGENGGGRAA